MANNGDVFSNVHSISARGLVFRVFDFFNESEF